MGWYATPVGPKYWQYYPSIRGTPKGCLKTKYVINCITYLAFAIHLSLLIIESFTFTYVFFFDHSKIRVNFYFDSFIDNL